MYEIEGVLTVVEPGDVDGSPEIPLVIDSPHSGVQYPQDFDYVASHQKMQWNVDMYVDELMKAAPANGAALLYAHFPRCYVDAHRSPEDIDISMLEGPWPHPINPSVKTELGRGLIRKFADKDMPIYNRKLGVTEVENRIDKYYQPYHQTLKRLLDERYQKFGGVWHVNMHSMPPFGRVLHEDPGKPRPDMALANKDGDSASMEFLEFAGDQLSDQGFEVWLNKPYKGQILITAYSDPKTNRHSIQIELNRKHYMEWDKTLEKTEGFGTFQLQLTRFLEGLKGYVSSKI